MRGQAILEAAAVTKGYPGSMEIQGSLVLRGVDISISPGQTLAIVGPSGSGKSTLLNILGILDRPDSGKVHIQGEDVLSMDEKRRALIRNRSLGFVFQEHHLLPQCTVFENVLIPALIYSSKEEKTRAADRARSLLEVVGLFHRLDYRPARLSGGERQRVAVVRALINEPQILLADEPTGSLDASTGEGISNLLLQINQDYGTAMIIVTHSQALADRMSVRYRLEDGVLKQ